jgi:hypothetical protein
MAKRAKVEKNKAEVRNTKTMAVAAPARERRAPQLPAMAELADLQRQAEESARQRGGFMENYDSAIIIDKHALDDCVVQQPELFYRVAERLALEISLRDEIKDRLTVVQAEADAQIRRDAEIGEIKVTESAIKMEVVRHPDVIIVRDMLAALNKSVGLLQALKESYSQRSYMLKELVSLHLASYYGDETATASGAKDRTYVKNRKALQEERNKRRSTG